LPRRLPAGNPGFKEESMQHAIATVLDALRGRCTGAVVAPGDDGWDAARQAWNLRADQHPAAVAVPVDDADVVAVVNFAREAGLRVAAQGTGHNATARSGLEDAILVRMSEMRGVEVDPDRRIARVRAGALWLDVVQATHPHGLAGLSGSSPDVGVVGYSLGGGIGWLARRYGMQTNSVRAVELVTADGTLVRADEEHEADLFWALRGGGGNYGVVTAMEFAVYPVAEVYGGAVAWDWERGPEVLGRWAEWTATLPDEVTTSARLLQLPDFPQIPEPIRGRNLVMVDGAILADADEGAALLAPLRELGPEIDMWQPMPPVGLVHIHGDPEEPVPGASGHCMLDALPPEAVDTFAALNGRGSGSPLLMAELRHLGGALGRPADPSGALPALDGAYNLFGVGIAMGPQVTAAIEGHMEGLLKAMAPWSNQSVYLNFTENPTDCRAGYDEETYARLRAIRSEVDPGGLFLANHPIPPKT
jgi:hypothetical protein